MRDAADGVRTGVAAAVAALRGADPGGGPAPLLRLVAGHLAAERAAGQARPVPYPERAGWGPETAIDEEGVGFDSLGRLALVARVNRAFRLHETGTEDYLLVRSRLGDWAEIVGTALAMRGDAASVVFETSGSTGEPKLAAHPLAALTAEAETHAVLFPDARRVVSLVPPHHVFGFLFAVLGPALRGLPVLDLHGAGPGRAVSVLEGGDLIVATPHLWDLVLTGGAALPVGLEGVTSTAPCPPALWERLAEAGLARLTEVYGATETAGIGTRTAPDAPYSLMPVLARGAGGLRRRIDGAPVVPVDRLDWQADGRFRVAGRLDGAVQVGGVNVHPARIAAVLAEAEGVAAAAVRLDGAGPAARLKAFLARRSGAEDAAVEAAARAHADARLSSPERPGRYTVGVALPRTALGKPGDWA